MNNDTNNKVLYKGGGLLLVAYYKGGKEYCKIRSMIELVFSFGHKKT
jgi:hypothetical protein